MVGSVCIDVVVLGVDDAVCDFYGGGGMEGLDLSSSHRNVSG